MSVLPDVMTGLNGAWEVVKPYKEAIFGLVTILGGAAAAFFGGYRRQAKKPEEALAQAASYTSSVTVTRIHHDDREAIGDLRESVHEMTRTARRLTGAIEDLTEAFARGGSGGGGGRTLGL